MAGASGYGTVGAPLTTTEPQFAQWRRVERGELRVHGRERDPASSLAADANIRIFLQARIELARRFAHPVRQVGNEMIRVEWGIQRLVIVFAVAVGIAVSVSVFAKLLTVS